MKHRLQLLLMAFFAPAALITALANETTDNQVKSLAGQAKFETVINLPGCAAGDSGVLQISSVDDWSLINDSRYNVFCVAPGDYRKAGKIRLDTSGSAETPRVIRYYDAANPSLVSHAVKIQPGRQAYIQGLHFTGANYWLIDRLSIVNNDPDDTLHNLTVDLRENSSGNLLQNSLVEGGRIGLRIHSSHFNIIQKNVVRETVSTADDDNCINIEGEPNEQVRGNRIIANEAYNCTDSMQLVTLSKSHGNLTFPGTVIAHNDFYLQPASRYTDCKGNPDPEGVCSTAEGRFDIKGGGTGSSVQDRVWVTSNRIWGARRTDPQSHGGSSWGSGLAVCCSPEIKFLLIEDNVIFDNARGISVSIGKANTVVIRNNLLFDIKEAVENTGHALLGLSETGNVWSGNTVIDSTYWNSLQGYAEQVSCNVVIDSAGGDVTQVNSSVTGNYYYGSATPPENDTAPLAQATSGNQEFCFSRKLLTGPETFCIPNALPSSQSPHQGKCGYSAGSQ